MKLNQNNSISITEKICLEKGIPYQKVRCASSLFPEVPKWTGEYLEIPVPEEDYFYSEYISISLHEIAHWLESDPERRVYCDFGLINENAKDRKKYHKTPQESLEEEFRVQKRETKLRDEYLHDIMSCMWE